MKQPIKGLIVRSTSGRDLGRFYVIVAISEDGFVRLADGKLHSIRNPKRKNPKHLAFTARVVAVDQTTTDRKLRQWLAPYQGAPAQTEPDTIGTTER